MSLVIKKVAWLVLRKLYISHFLYGEVERFRSSAKQAAKVGFCDLGFADNCADVFQISANDSDI